MIYLCEDTRETKNIMYSIAKSMVDNRLGFQNINQCTQCSLDTTTALIYDSVNAFAMALNELSSVQDVYQTTLDCLGQDTWIHGNSLMNYMKVNTVSRIVCNPHL